MDFSIEPGKICYVTDYEVRRTLDNGAIVVTSDPVEMAEIRAKREEYIRLHPEEFEPYDD